MSSDSAPLLNVLTAYPFVNERILGLVAAHKDTMRFVLDSGAFTAWKQGTPISLDDYCNFIEALPIVPWRYFTLDVVGDAAASLRNYETMLARGFTPVPIFTRGEDPSMLDHYYRTSDVVGVGGLVGTPNKRGFVNGIMRHIGTRRAHWLGFTNLSYIKVYRPYMCDSSDWMKSARFAEVKLYLGSGRARMISKRTFQQRPAPEIMEAVRGYGVEPTALARNANWSGGQSLSRALAAASAIRESLDIQRTCGTLVFLATPTWGYIETLTEIFDNGLRVVAKKEEMADAA